MKYKIENDIILVKDNGGGFGFRISSNLSPEELKNRIGEIKELLKKWEFEWNVVFDREGCSPNPNPEIEGFWSYFVEIC